MAKGLDYSRIVLVLAAGAGALLMMVWWAMLVSSGAHGDQQVLREPPGTEVVLSLLRVISIDGADRYVVGQGTLRIPVQGPTERLSVGMDVTVGGVVQPSFVRASWVRPAVGRPKKRLLGVIGLTLGCTLLLGSVRPVESGLMLRGWRG